MPNNDQAAPALVRIATNPLPHPSVRYLRRHSIGDVYQGEQFPLPTAAPPAVYPRPPHLEPPSMAFHFDEVAPTSLIAAGGSATLISLEVTPGYLAAVRRFGQNADDFSPLVRWRFLVNGAPVRPFPDLAGQVGLLTAPTEVLVELGERDVFSLLVFNGLGIGVNVAARIGGWFWPV